MITVAQYDLETTSDYECAQRYCTRVGEPRLIMSVRISCELAIDRHLFARMPLLEHEQPFGEAFGKKFTSCARFRQQHECYHCMTSSVSCTPITLGLDCYGNKRKDFKSAWQRANFAISCGLQSG